MHTFFQLYLESFLSTSDPCMKFYEQLISTTNDRLWHFWSTHLASEYGCIIVVAVSDENPIISKKISMVRMFCIKNSSRLDVNCKVEHCTISTLPACSVSFKLIYIKRHELQRNGLFLWNACIPKEVHTRWIYAGKIWGWNGAANSIDIYKIKMAMCYLCVVRHMIYSNNTSIVYEH